MSCDDFLDSHPPLEVVFHLGAVSETTAVDGDHTWATNVELSRYLWEWCAQRGVRFVYASSASTYGDGAQGFEDDFTLAGLEKLRPLNLYGWTKHAFDLLVARQLAPKPTRPPQWAGLKFFNVYGPNEYHKGKMISVVKVKHDEVAAGGPARLFKSDQPGLADGAQSRDFIWVGDVVDVMLWLLETPGVNGLFNLGTGRARTYLDLAHAVCDAAGQAAAGAVHRHAAQSCRAVPVLHPGADGAAACRRLRRAVHPAGRGHTALRPGPSRDGRSLRMIPVLLFPQFDPVIVQLGPLSIRWYALAYIVSLVLGWRLVRRLVQATPVVATPLQVDDFLTWATLGVVLGGRLGYVLFYQPAAYLAHPAQIFAVWEGGMSFHGGMLGVAIACILFCRKEKIPLLGFADRIAIVAPIGLGLGRVANFINGELWGRPAPDWLPWAMIFPRAGDDLPRHPSQIYQALLEGVLLLTVMAAAVAAGEPARPLRPADRRVPVRLWRRPHHRRVLPRAGCVPGLPRLRHHDGTDPVGADDPGRHLADRAGETAPTA